MISLLIVLVIAAVGVIAYDSNRFVVRRITVSDRKVKEPVRLLFISDLHSKRYGKDNKRLLAALSKIECDGAVLAGDMMTAHKDADFTEAVRIVRYLSSRMPVFYSMGNHETRAKENKAVYKDLYDRFIGSVEGGELTFLDNECAEFKGIDIKGLSIPGRFYKKTKHFVLPVEDIKAMVGDRDDSRFCLLLAHDPEYFDGYAEYGADLVLSGHFHGGIVRLFGWGLISPRFTLFPKYSGGLYKKNDTRMFVNCGLGSHTIPWRMFNPGEIIILNIEPSDL